MDLKIQSCTFNNYTNRRKTINFKGVLKPVEKRVMTKSSTNVLKSSLLSLGVAIFAFLSPKKGEKELTTQDLIDADMKTIISNHRDVVFISKQMKKNLRKNGKAKSADLKSERKKISSLSIENKSLFSKNLNLILQNEKYKNLPKGYYYRIKKGLYSLLEKNPNSFVLNESIVDWKIDVLRVVDSLR